MLYLPHTTKILFQIKSLLSLDEAVLQFRTKVTKQFSQSQEKRDIAPLNYSREKKRDLM